MPTERESIMIQKATVYDIQKILEPGRTYTTQEIIELTDAYIRGVEQK